MILIDSQKETITTALGDGSAEYVVNNSILMQILIIPDTSSTTYDFSISDVNANTVFSETNCSGEFNQLVAVPVYGNIDLAITNSSVDEDFECILTFRRS